jgi:hypothetical protein
MTGRSLERSVRCLIGWCGLVTSLSSGHITLPPDMYEVTWLVDLWRAQSHDWCWLYCGWIDTCILSSLERKKDAEGGREEWRGVCKHNIWPLVPNSSSWCGCGAQFHQMVPNSIGVLFCFNTWVAYSTFQGAQFQLRHPILSWVWVHGWTWCPILTNWCPILATWCPILVPHALREVPEWHRPPNPGHLRVFPN